MFTQEKTANMALFIFQVVLLSLAWCAFSGIFDAFHLGVGLLSAIAITLINQKHFQSNLGITALIRRVITSFLYIGWLLTRIVLAAIHVTKLILAPQSKLNPKLIKHKSSLRGNSAKTLFANSITLTPGTITAEINGDEFTIHQIDTDSAGDIVGGEMEKQIQRIFKGN